MFSRARRTVAAALHAVGRTLPVLARDSAGLGAIGLISYGAWLIYEPAGFIAAGILLLALVMLVGGKPQD